MNRELQALVQRKMHKYSLGQVCMSREVLVQAKHILLAVKKEQVITRILVQALTMLLQTLLKIQQGHMQLGNHLERPSLEINKIISLFQAQECMRELIPQTVRHIQWEENQRSSIMITQDLDLMMQIQIKQKTLQEHMLLDQKKGH